MRANVVVASAVAALSMTLGAGCAKNIPPPEVKITSDEAQLARGKYLAEGAMGCIACHSKRDWSKFGGPPVEGTLFGGSGNIAREDHFPPEFSFHGPNLTPHALKTWSDGEVVRAILVGQNKEGRGMFPMMPYMVWRDIVPIDDAAAVTAYLRTVPAIENTTPPNEFPIPGFVMNGFPDDRPLKTTAPKPGDPGYGAYVVARSACIECHTQADERGQLIGVPFAGGREFAIPDPGKGFVYSANLTPHAETGIGNMTKEAFLERFKTSTLDVARNTPVAENGYNTMMPWWMYSALTEEDLSAMYDFLRALPPTANKVEKHSLTKKAPAK